MSNKYCAVCGNELHGRQIKYCSKKCMGLGKQNYKTCPVCGKKFKDSESNDTVCCSAKCSKIHRSQLHQSGVYDESIKNMRTGFSKKIDEIGADNHWFSKHWVIESPTGEIYECDNLMNFIRKNPDLFDGTPSQAFDGFQKIKATMNGKWRKSPSKSWKGWHLIGYSENDNKYHKSKKKKKGYMHIDYKQYADLSALTDRESEIFKMRQSGMPCWKIAEKCGIKETSVQMSLNKSIKKIKRHIRQGYRTKISQGTIPKYDDGSTKKNITNTIMNRSIQAEGSFANIKEDMGFRRYLYRGKENVTAQSILLAIGYNINKLHHKIQTGRTGRHLFPLKQTA